MEDPRCCGTGTCIINAEGLCWCGQQWNGTRMCFPQPAAPSADQQEQPGKKRGDPSASDEDEH